MCHMMTTCCSLIAVSLLPLILNLHMTTMRAVQAVETWRGILKAIQLTPEQRRQMLELRRRFLRRCGTVLQDRQRIAGQLQVGRTPLPLNRHDSQADLLAHSSFNDLQWWSCATVLPDSWRVDCAAQVLSCVWQSCNMHSDA